MKICFPYLGESELAEIKKVFKKGQVSQGPAVADFEDQVKTFVGMRHAIAVNSCTSALHLSLLALDLKKGDEVIVPDFTFPATAHAVIHAGGTPVLADIHPDTLTLDPLSFRSKITSKTKAVIPVHTFGCPANMDPILKIARTRGIHTIEDAAGALGSTYQQKACGSIGAISCFSFHGRKIITTGEGGMVLTNSKRFAQRVFALRNHGSRKQKYWFSYEEAGFNYRLSDIQAAVGIAQMKKLRIILGRRRTLALKLIKLLSSISELRLPCDPKWGKTNFQSFVVLIEKGINRDLLVKDLRKAGIETTLGTYSLHTQPEFRAFGYRAGALPESYLAFRQSLTLPLYVQMTSGDLKTLANKLKRAILAQRK